MDELDRPEPLARTGLHDIEYLGDGAYVGRDNFQVWVLTCDGYNVRDRIALPPDGTFQNLVRYGERLYGIKR